MHIISLREKDSDKVLSYDGVVAYNVGHGYIQLRWFDGVTNIILLDPYKDITAKPMTEEENLNCSYPGHSEWFNEMLEIEREKERAAQEAAEALADSGAQEALAEVLDAE